ncbi:MAG: zinc-ribbon domain-containing protein [Planctomycetota bacterium]|nr:zinc-ribbon domain-containing protein [Planctomycetota bacterium]MDA0970838.1 zinc-ribbon domain-containing protein [Planctomycetota bacterium]
MTALGMDDDFEADEWADDEAFASDSADDSDDDPTVVCPYCGEEMYDDAPQCAACGSYISAEDHAAARKPAWIVVTALVCLAMAFGWVLLG